MGNRFLSTTEVGCWSSDIRHGRPTLATARLIILVDLIKCTILNVNLTCDLLFVQSHIPHCMNNFTYLFTYLTNA